MSTQSIASLPPELEMTARSIPFLVSQRKTDTLKTSGNVNQSCPNSVRKSNLTNSITYSNISTKNHRTLFKLSETSLRVTENQPVNFRIMLHAADQLTSARPRKVKNERSYCPFQYRIKNIKQNRILA